MADLKKTPLHAIHESLGAKLVDFAGFSMPVAYGSIIEEHTAVRERAGIFDVSHMGEFLVKGPGARDFIDGIVTNDCSRLKPGRLLYTVMCREDGTVVDDLLVYHLTDHAFMLVVNAANIKKDWSHIDAFDRDEDVELTNISNDLALIAVQGPKTREVMLACPLFASVREQIESTPYYYGFSVEYEGQRIGISRTGYTGELGFEIFVPNALAETFWHGLTAAGEAHGMMPVGLGARDTLRFEASMCLYGHELDDETSPLEAGLQWLVKLKKDHFMGQDALLSEKREGSRRTLVGLELDGRNIARQGYEIMRDGRPVGKVTSGAFAPTLQKSLCMALVTSDSADADAFEVSIRNKTIPAIRTRMPFYPSRAR